MLLKSENNDIINKQLQNQLCKISLKNDQCLISIQIYAYLSIRICNSNKVSYSKL